MSIYLPSFYKEAKSIYVPRRREISDVTNALEALVTTTEDHGYELGQVITLIVPIAYGMVLNFVTGTILTIPSTTSFTITINTSQLGIFIAPTAPPAFTEAHCVPVTGLEQNIARQAT